MRGTIREHQSVQAKLAVIRLITKITAVGPECLAVVIFFGQRLIHPVPDESALQARVATERLPVFGKPAKAVAHRMGVLAQNQRACLVRHADPFLNRPFGYRRERLILIDTGVHRADDIRRGGVCPAAFILNGTRRVGGFYPAIQGIVIRAVARLVAQRPDNDRRMITVALHHARHALAHGR
ncbi:hypothetical protein D3C76_975640 [compost metagenome]